LLLDAIPGKDSGIPVGVVVVVVVRLKPAFWGKEGLLFFGGGGVVGGIGVLKGGDCCW